MRRVLVVLGFLAALVLLTGTPAGAHPLGNFSVNQYLGLTVHSDRIDALAIIDVAEIPTLQGRPLVDTSADGTVSSSEQSAYAATTCTAVAADVTVQVGPDHLVWTVTQSSFEYAAGAGGLDVSRLRCTLTTAAALSSATQITVDNHYLADRVGWREMTAVGDGVRLVDSPLPTISVSKELTSYPQDLLASTLDVRSATIRVEPVGTDTPPMAGGPSVGSGASPGGAGSAGSAAGGGVVFGGGDDPVSRWMAAVDRRFQDLAGGPHLTPLVGLLAVGLALLLGAGHAALPGHGKTILAAYLAGRRGRPRDAVTVAGTVTLTHTGGVLILGLILTAGTALAGEQILAWLGLASGSVILVVGATMLLPHLRRLPHPRRLLRPRSLAGGPSRVLVDAGHPRAHENGAIPGHSRSSHDGSHVDGEHGASTAVDHTHGTPGHQHTHGRVHSHGPIDHPHGHSHGFHGHSHGHSHEDGHSHGGTRGKWGLAGIGVAGGLVPSPSALVVLLAAIGLGRTGFGIVLVIAYGVGMAATLTGAGLLLLALQRRMQRRTPWAWVTRIAARLNTMTPTATAALVFIVGAGLATRAAFAVL
jgi:ABC-type nickel/cobalt efflux system permease component RcnA